MLSETKTYSVRATLFVLFCTFAGGAYVGYNFSQGRYQKSQYEAQNTALEAAREESIAGKREAVGRVQREVVAAGRARAVRSRGLNDASLKATDNCVRDAESYSLLVDAVGIANGTEAGTGSVPEDVREGSGPSRWLGQVGKSLGVRDD